MGAYVSNWRLARAVAMERPGETAGTVSGTALDVIYVRLLQLGDPGGHVRRALNEFDARYATDIGQRISQRYYIEGGKAPDAYFKSAPMQIPHALDGKTTFAAATGSPITIPLKLDDSIVELLIATGFAEVWLAKQGHERQDLHQLPQQDRAAAPLCHVRRHAGGRRRRDRGRG